MHPLIRQDRLRLAFVSTYRPVQCGIATYTEDLRRAVPGEHSVIAVQREPTIKPVEVAHTIDQEDRASYLRAALVANRQFDAVSLQHEYGIFGGPDGEYVLDFLASLTIPCIPTLHTVLPEPSENQRRVLKEIAARSYRVMVMSLKAVDILASAYNVSPSKIVVIPHGVPNPEGVSPAFELMPFEKSSTLLTFGLLSPGKGIETAIRAVALLKGEFPALRYVILGATHPELRRQEGESYRMSLQSLTAELGVETNVCFIDQFTPKELLCRFLAGAGLYVTPYVGKDQIVSGTLAYAAAFGLPILSTPFSYASELADHGAAVLFPFGEHEQLAVRLRELLTGAELRASLSSAAYQLGKGMRWHVVGNALGNEFQSARRIIRPKTRTETTTSVPVKVSSLSRACRDSRGLGNNVTLR